VSNIKLAVKYILGHETQKQKQGLTLILETKARININFRSLI